MRLDFSTFVITGPSTSTTTAYSILNGEITPAGGSGASHGTRCLTDTFSVSPAADYNPTICGTNTGEHSKLDILFCQITTFIKVRVSFIFGLQIL